MLFKSLAFKKISFTTYWISALEVYSLAMITYAICPDSVSQKKHATVFLGITYANVDRFPKFFHC